MSSRGIQLLIVVAILTGIALLFRPGSDPVNEQVATPYSISEQVVPESAPPESMTEANSSVAIEELSDLVEASPPALEKAVTEPMQDPELAVEQATDPIMHLIPDWLLESGDVRRERVQVDGHWAGRVRSRYEWENGSQVEVEVTDLGSEATGNQFKSLGFDFDLQAETTDGNFSVLHDGQGYFFNLEYNEEDCSGYVQYVITERYLIEVQIENLSIEAFQSMDDGDGLLAALLKMDFFP